MMSDDVRPMNLSRFATLWRCDAEWEREGPQSVHIWEPLEVDAPADARPVGNGGGEVTFYDRTGNQLIIRNVRYHTLDCLEDLVLLSDGCWYQMTSGQYVYRNGRWWVRWLAYRNTRLAIMARTGFWAFQYPEGGVDMIQALAQRGAQLEQRAREQLRDVAEMLRLAETELRAAAADAAEAQLATAAESRRFLADKIAAKRREVRS